MFYEYALDPTLLSSWDRVRFFLDAFGPWKGRFLAEYPRRWKKMVYDGCASCPDVERSRIFERLAKLDRRVFSPRSSASYDSTRAWLENAATEHARQGFHAIVAALSAPSSSPHVLDGAQVDETHERWRVPTGRLVARDPVQVMRALGLLLRASRAIIMIDPYFRADQDDKTRPLIALCGAVIGRATIEVHFADAPRGFTQCLRDAARALPELLPEGAKVMLHCWKERVGGPRLHNRYLLTDVAGVKFGDGIEKGSAGHEDHLSILDEPSRLQLWEQYVGSQPAFEKAGPPQEFVGASKRKYR